ncbi:histidine kinase [Nonomuraea sp. B5E05]|uniref:sensor histidine kinase n=1 Tax=Nonomuraea sp. B5E05 TaxID=3153569 RepID=UPI003260A7C4
MVIILVVLAGVAFDPLAPLPGVPAIVMLILQIVHSLPRPRRLVGPWTLVAQALLFVWAGQGAPGLLTASVLLIARGPARWVLAGAVVAVTGLLNTADVYTCVNAMVNALTQGLVVFGVTRLNDLRAELHAARNELAEASVAEERERASREFESVLGSSLSAITALAAQGRTGEIVTLARRAAARARRAPPPQAQPPFDDLTPRLALPILVTVHLGFLIVSAVFLWRAAPPPAVLAPALLILAGVTGLQLRHSWPRPPGVRPAHARWTLPLQLALALAPLLFPERPYPQLIGYAAGSLLILWTRWAAFPVVGAVLAVTSVVMALRGIAPVDNLYWTFNALAIAVMFHGLALHTHMVAQVRQARLALAGIALERERRRIARDVHDLLGYSLSAIVVKAELAVRTPERSAEQLADITRIAERALADVAAIPRDSGRPLSLATELASAREVLSAAGADVHADPVIELPADIDALLAMVLREAVTNILRHSRARLCRIELTSQDATARLRITNDGVTDADADTGTDTGTDTHADTDAAPPGQGLRNLTQRVSAHGGSLRTSRVPGGYELLVLQPTGFGRDADGVEPVAGP